MSYMLTKKHKGNQVTSNSIDYTNDFNRLYVRFDCHDFGCELGGSGIDWHTHRRRGMWRLLLVVQTFLMCLEIQSHTKQQDQTAYSQAYWGHMPNTCFQFHVIFVITRFPTVRFPRSGKCFVLFRSQQRHAHELDFSHEQVHANMHVKTYFYTDTHKITTILTYLSLVVLYKHKICFLKDLNTHIWSNAFL